jgi:hypothetical protein
MSKKLSENGHGLGEFTGEASILPQGGGGHPICAGWRRLFH